MAPTARSHCQQPPPSSSHGEDVVRVMNLTGGVAVTDEIKWQITSEYLARQAHHGNNNVKKVKILFYDRQSSLDCITVNSTGDSLTRSPLNTVFSQPV